jgi:hypothetical protein
MAHPWAIPTGSLVVILSLGGVASNDLGTLPVAQLTMGRVAVEAGSGAVPVVATATPSPTPTKSGSAGDRKKFQVRGTAVVGGPSLIDAPKLQPGVFNDTIRQGEVLWYSVDLVQGEGVVARVTIRTAGVSKSAGVQLDWVDVATKPLATSRLNGVGTAEATTLAARTGVMDGSRTATGAVREPGPQYLAVRLTGFPAKQRNPFVLEVFRDSESDTAAPSLSPSSGSTAEDDAPDAGIEPEPLPASSAQRSSSSIPLLLTAFGAVGGGAFLVWRRRRAARSSQDTVPYL